MVNQIVFDPLVPLVLIYGLSAVYAVFLIFSALRGSSGWWLRGLAGAALLLAIANPSIKQEERDLLSDVVLAIVDETASQTIGDRATQTQSALDAIESGRGSN